jgi:putative toxin-antitoxin system antitoxin component (TIGR02293 family)
MVKRGLDVGTVDRLGEQLGVPRKAVTDVVRIAPRTLARRKKENAGRLKPEESERVLRLSLLFERAAAVLGGPDAARDWFKRPCVALGGAAPLAYADTEPGAREVEALLLRIEDGVFS